MFSDTIRELPFNSRTPQAAGFFPPMWRAAGHVQLLLEYVADPAHTVTEEEALGELQAAAEHWDNRTVTENVSTPINERAILIGTAIQAARTEFSDWDETARTNNLRDLANRIAQHIADLDRELVGITESDPGTSL